MGSLLLEFLGILYFVLFSIASRVASSKWDLVESTLESFQAIGYQAPGVFWSGNSPGARFGAASWVAGGKFYLFGGYGFASTGTEGQLGDTWVYDPILTQWAFLTGFDHVGETMCVDCNNDAFGADMIPIPVSYPVSWVENDDRTLGMFGGFNIFEDSLTVWRYYFYFDTLLGWWRRETSCLGDPNYDGNWYYGATNWAGQSSVARFGNSRLYIFGGKKAQEFSSCFNDMYEYCLDSAYCGASEVSKSRFISGQNEGQPTYAEGVYGPRGAFSTGYIPPGRRSAMMWTDSSEYVWIFGGTRTNSNEMCRFFFNDLWAFRVSDNAYSHVAGTPRSRDGWIDGTGFNHPYECDPDENVADANDFHADNIPGSRHSAVTFVTHRNDDLFVMASGVGPHAPEESGYFYMDTWVFSMQRNMWKKVAADDPAAFSDDGGQFGARVDAQVFRWPSEPRLLVYGGKGPNEAGSVFPLNDFYERKWFVMPAECTDHGDLTYTSADKINYVAPTVDTCACDGAQYSGDDCELWNCWGVPNTDLVSVCTGKGACVDADTCICEADILGVNCSIWSCYTTDRMDAGVCSGHGTCEHHDTCVCDSEDYSGDECEEWSCNSFPKDDEDACPEHSFCAAADYCTCVPNYYGVDCVDFDCWGIKQGTASVCGGRGVCESPDSCSCDANVFGTNCSDWLCFGVSRTNASEVCSGRGECLSFDTCDCASPYMGASCDYHECFGVPHDSPDVCSGHGTCEDVDTCVCEISGDYAGSECQEFECFGVSNDLPSVCSSLGDCIAKDTCVCSDGVEGPRCTLFNCSGVPEADSGVCNGHGVCMGPDVCNCVNDSYVGPFCGDWTCMGISRWDSPCGGHGDCVDFDDCDCGLNYDGAQCLSWSCFGYDRFDSSVCNQNGICIQYNDCKCAKGYSEAACDYWECYDTERTSDAVCGGHGVCRGYDDCECDSADYSGRECGNWECNGVSRSFPATCSSHGTCTDVDTCFCGGSGDYGGGFCEEWDCHGISRFDSGVCSGSGDCFDVDMCDCLAGYNGSSCSIWSCGGIFATDGDVCNGHGDCTAMETCSCYNSSFVGLLCEEWSCFGISRSDSLAVCSGVAPCIDIDHCDCPNGRSGLSCEFWECFGFDSADPGACSGHGACLTLDTCLCDVDLGTGSYAGANCSHCLPSFEGSSCTDFRCGGVLATDVLTTCDGHGTCVAPNVCNCNSPYYGADDDIGSCALFDCYGVSVVDEHVCSSAGTCVGPDSCDCTAAFSHGTRCNEVIAAEESTLYEEFGILVLSYVVPWVEMTATEEYVDCESVFVDLEAGDGARCRWTFAFDSTQTLVIELGAGYDRANLQELHVRPVTTPDSPVDISVLRVEPPGGEEDVVTVGDLAKQYWWGIMLSVMALCICLLLGALLGVGFLIGAVYYRNRNKRFDGVENLDVMIDEALAATKDGRPAFTIKKSMFEVNYDDIKLIKRIGAGGSGATVYMGTWKDQRVAIKVFRTVDILTSEEDFDEFEREISVMRSISHPAVLRCYGCAFQNSRVAIIMEHCGRGDLRAFMSKTTRVKRGFFSFFQKCDLLAQIADGMDFLHDRNIIHRDLKLMNVLITEDFCARIMDFGLSRILNKDESYQQLTSRTGTSFYMAPEVTMGRQYGPPCDVFSFSIRQHLQSALARTVTVATRIMEESILARQRRWDQRRGEPRVNYESTKFLCRKNHEMGKHGQKKSKTGDYITSFIITIS